MKKWDVNIKVAFTLEARSRPEARRRRCGQRWAG